MNYTVLFFTQPMDFVFYASLMYTDRLYRVGSCMARWLCDTLQIAHSSCSWGSCTHDSSKLEAVVKGRLSLC